MQKEKSITKNYYVDEAGDANIFGRKKRVLLGKKGISNFFILGFVDIPNPPVVEQELRSFRESIINNLYYRGIPSLQPHVNKTFKKFHATDDLPEIRKEVYEWLKTHPEIKFQAAVKEKQSVLEYINYQSSRESSYRYHPNELYDHLVKRLFKNCLHKSDVYNIYFSKRGEKSRTKALFEALETARMKFCNEWGITSRPNINVIPAFSYQYAGLQVVDYFLWALQRLYEYGDDRFINFISSSVSLIIDIDDVHKHKYGTYYDKRNPISANALEKRKLNNYARDIGSRDRNP